MISIPGGRIFAKGSLQNTFSFEHIIFGREYHKSTPLN